MIETPQITHTEAQETAVIRLKIPKAAMQEAFGPAVGELMAAASEQGVEVVGPVFAHHFRMDPAVFDFEVGVPVARPLAPMGRVEASSLPAMKVARTTYRGPYEGLPQAWGRFHEWLERERLRWRSDVVERYLVQPDSDPDPAHWRTELVRPLDD